MCCAYSKNIVEISTYFLVLFPVDMLLSRSVHLYSSFDRQAIKIQIGRKYTEPNLRTHMARLGFQNYSCDTVANAQAEHIISKMFRALLADKIANAGHYESLDSDVTSVAESLNGMRLAGSATIHVGAGQLLQNQIDAVVDALQQVHEGMCTRISTRNARSN